MEITARDLARFVELSKKKAEYEFKKSVFGSDCVRELEAVSSGAAELRKRAARIDMVYPNQRKLDELASALGEFSPAEMKESIGKRGGRPYELLQERGAVVKSNHENRLEIAKLWLLAARMEPGAREKLLEAVASGRLDSPVATEALEAPCLRRLARVMRRCGIACDAGQSSLEPAEPSASDEVMVEVSNRNVWVSESVVPQLKDNLARIGMLNSRIQLKNAERQIKSFSDQEEQDFASLQMQYLELLKEQDELLREAKDEESLALKLQ